MAEVTGLLRQQQVVSFVSFFFLFASLLQRALPWAEFPQKEESLGRMLQKRLLALLGKTQALGGGMILFVHGCVPYFYSVSTWGHVASHCCAYLLVEIEEMLKFMP